MKSSIVLGTLGVVGLMGALLFVTVNEVDRMQTAERAYDSRAVETGALEFESRCRSCHGPQGEGTPRAPGPTTPSVCPPGGSASGDPCAMIRSTRWWPSS